MRPYILGYLSVVMFWVGCFVHPPSGDDTD